MEDGNDGVICDKGMYAGRFINISAGKKIYLLDYLVGRLWQTSITKWNCCSFFACSRDEIAIIELNDEKLSVDGNFALMGLGD